MNLWPYPHPSQQLLDAATNGELPLPIPCAYKDYHILPGRTFITYYFRPLTDPEMDRLRRVMGLNWLNIGWREDGTMVYRYLKED